MENFQTEYLGQTILYLEHQNVWAVDGMAIVKPSLTEAKNAVKLALKEDFKPFYALHFSFASVSKVTVTGTAGKQCMWIKTDSERCTKTNIDQLFPATDKNLQIYSKLIAVSDETSALNKVYNQLLKTFERGPLRPTSKDENQS